jgi:hypothetical protein
MALKRIEIGRLAIMQRSPLRYIERRHEHLDLTDDFHYGVTLVQQVEIPTHGERGKPSEQDVLIPLGQFAKDRLPDLHAEGPDGSAVPLLSREDRGRLGATLLTNLWARSFFSAAPKEDRDTARAAYKTIFALIATVVTSSQAGAEKALELLEETLTAWTQSGRKPEAVQLAALALLCDERFWIEADALARSRLLVARMRAMPGRHYALTVRHTERFPYHRRGRRGLIERLRSVVGALGLTATEIRRDVANVGQTASLWVVQSVPEGVEALRYYWASQRHSNRPSDPVSVQANRAVAAWHPRRRAPAADLLVLEVQMAPTNAIVAAIGLAVLLLLVSTYVYQAIPTLAHESSASHQMLASIDTPIQHGIDQGDRTLLVGLGSLFAAVPAAIAGALAYRGQPFVMRLSRVPRGLLGILSVLAGFFAVVVSLKNLGSMTEATAYVLSIYSLWVAGIFIYIQWGPRWRKSERTRWEWRTRRASPRRCRRNQSWLAFVWLVAWTFGVVLFAHCQVALQDAHFFSHEFPLNIWRALRSWS